MPASEHAAEQSAEREARSGRARPVPVASAVSMRDLLASCAAATAVSTPPRTSSGDAHRDAA
ncbi:hypothetical protein ACWD01_12595 [Streptomyces sp. NPDC002835]|jgi:hypothetical protein